MYIAQQTDRCTRSIIQTLEKGDVILVFLLLPLNIFTPLFGLWSVQELTGYTTNKCFILDYIRS